MSTDVALQHRLYLKQVALLKAVASQEVLPVSFNYQGIIIVETGVVETEGGGVVFQTHSCGCGPQPQIRGAWQDAVVAWRESHMRTALAALPEAREAALAAQTLIPFVYRIRRVTDAFDRERVTTALQGWFGNGRKIVFF